MLRSATKRYGLLVTMACAALVAAGCGGDTNAGAVCGNGVIEGDEMCDDENTVDGDGCSATCTVEGAQCGNNIIETGEECDDGNTDDGDGCDSVCSLEVPPGCGNDVVEMGEGCDDGNTDDCDGCSSTCSMELCGNGVTECTEECDDGNATPGDGCDSDCTLETGGCGDGVIDTGEECDDGNTAWGDGCDSDCQLEVMPGCGNGVVEVGEQCDDGNLNDCDGCSAGCDDELCGNGVTECAEQCDDGNTTPGDGCDAACQSEIVPTCGNATLEAGEDCDDGNTDNTDACLNNCTDASCGDNHVWTGTEQCDDGNTTPGDGCDAACQLEVAPGCGNGVLEVGEGCDDGNTDNTDACLNNCTNASCGDNHVWTGTEQCDDGNTTAGDGCSSSCTPEYCDDDYALSCGGSDSYNNGGGGSLDVLTTYGCIDWDESGPEFTYLYTAALSGYVVIDLTVTTAGQDLDVFVISQSNGLCSPTNCVAYGDTQAIFYAVAGEAYYIIVDGAGGAVADYDIAMTCFLCGDGNLDFGEECDDNNNNNGDGCDASCEQEGVECSPGNALSCGDTDTWHNRGGGHTNNVASYSCNSWDESGPEFTYFFAPANSGDVTVDLSGMTGNLDIYVLNNTTFDCDPTNCATYGDNSVTFTVTGGDTYFLVVDGFEGAESDYTIDVSCTNP